MGRLSIYIPPFAGDYSGVCSALYDFNCLIVLCDANCCTKNYIDYDEPRWSRGKTTTLCAQLRTMEVTLGDDSRILRQTAEAAQALAHVQGRTRLTAELSGRKLYFFPPGLSKGDALVRLREKFAPARVLCAGDSGIDVPMLEQADVAIVPKRGMVAGGVVWDGRGRFSEFVVETVAAFGGGI